MSGTTRNCIDTLELFKDVVGRSFFREKTALQGFNIAIRILRRLEVVESHEEDDVNPRD